MLTVQPTDHILEAGFGPGVGIECLAAAVPDGFVAGIDYSQVMVRQASRRNAALIRAGKVKLVHGSATELPFADGSFTKALSVNSLWLWPDPLAGLREMRRVLKPGATVAITYTPASGQSGDNLVSQLLEAGFREARLERGSLGVTALALSPD